MRRTCLVVVGSVVALVLAACGSERTSQRVGERDAAALLIDRNWLDRWPTDKDDHLEVYRFVPSMGGGVYQDRTMFEGRFELFQFRADGRAIDFTFPHTGQRHHTGYRIERVTGPAPFDLALRLDHDPRGPGIYYGLSSDRGLVDVEQLVRARR